MGKRFLAERVRRSATVSESPVILHDESDPDVQVPSDAFEFPLIPIPRHHVLRWFDDEVWNASAGHPYLMAGAAAGRWAEHRERLRGALESYRERETEAFEAWEHARSFVGSPAERYRELRSRLPEAKQVLGRASLLGLINRSMFGDAAGVVAVPV